MSWQSTSLAGRATGRIARSIPLFLLAVAAVQLAVGARLLWRHYSDARAGSMRASFGVLFIVAAVVGLLAIRRRWGRGAGFFKCAMGSLPALAELRVLSRKGGQAAHGTPSPQLMTSPADRSAVRFRKRLYWRWLAVGFIGCYVVCLMLGPDPSRQNAFWTAVAWWHTALVWSLTAPPQKFARLTTFLRRRSVLAVGWTAYALVMVVLVGELGLRALALATGDRPAERYIARGQTLPPGSQIRGRQVNTQGYWDEEFQTARAPGVMRVAVLGDEMTLSGDATSNCLAQVEQLNRGVEIYNFGLPGVGPREYAAQVTGDVSRYEPQLVMLFISVGDDITSQLPMPGMFDWRGLHLYQAGAKLFSDRPAARPMPQISAVEPTDRRDYLNRCAGRLSVCRTPLSRRMRRRWQEVEAHLHEVARECRRRDVPLVVVVVPADFQVNRVLCDSMRRRLGYTPEQVDLELPQRRLREFADSAGLPLLDLLPEFKADGPKLYVRHQNLWNQRGNTKAALLIDAWLRSRYPAEGERIARVER